MTYPRWPPPNWATSGLEFKMFIPRSNELSRLCLTMFVCFLTPPLSCECTAHMQYPPPRNRLVECLAPRHEFMEYHQFRPSFALIALFITLKLRCFYCFFSTYLYPRFQTWLHFPVRDSRVRGVRVDDGLGGYQQLAVLYAPSTKKLALVRKGFDDTHGPRAR